MPSDNPFMRRAAQRGIGGTGRASEKKMALSLGARQTPASGAMRGAKSDAVLGDFRIESKSTTGGSIPLSIGWLSKISHEALTHTQCPAVTIAFVKLDGSPAMQSNAEWVMIPKWKFQELIGD